MTDDPTYTGKHPDGRAPDSESDKMTPAKRHWLDDLPPLNERMAKPSDLPKWAKLGLTMYGVGMCETMKEAAEEVGKSAGTFYNYKNTPGGEAWLKTVQDISEDPVRLSEMVLKSNLHHFTIDFMAMWEAAKDANDYAEIRKFWESINDRIPGGLQKKGDIDVGQATITVNFGSPEDLEPEIVETEYEEIEADVELLDD